MNLLARIVRRLAYRTGRFKKLYVRVCRPTPAEYAEFYRSRNLVHAMGEGCTLLPTTNIMDPHLVILGNNVHLSACTLICHDGSVAVLSRAYNTTLEGLGVIHIKDNSYVGYGAVVLRGVTIGPGSIVAPGAIVTRDVPPNTVVSGIPARPIGMSDAFIEKLAAGTQPQFWEALL